MSLLHPNGYPAESRARIALRTILKEALEGNYSKVISECRWGLGQEPITVASSVTPSPGGHIDVV